MSCVARSYGSIASKRDSSNLGVPGLDRRPRFLAVSLPRRRLVRRVSIKPQDATAKQIVQGPLDVSLKLPPSSAVNQPFSTRPQLQDSNCGREKLPRPMATGPREHPRVRHLVDELRNHIGVENNHFSNLGTRMRQFALSSSMPFWNWRASSSVSPVFLNRSYIRAPKLSSSLSCLFAELLGGRLPARLPFAAFSRIARASPSKVRPWRLARALSRSFTWSWSLRTINCAMHEPSLDCSPVHGSYHRPKAKQTA